MSRFFLDRKVDVRYHFVNMRNKQIRDLHISVKVAKALADKSRLRIMAALLHREEICVCQLTEMLGLAVSTVSRHISSLQAAGLVTSRKQHRWVYYKFSKEVPSEIRNWLMNHVVNTEEAILDRERLNKVFSCDPRDP